MWFTLLLMAVAVSLEPFRIAMTVLMINRPRPVHQLLVFLAGGFAMGIAVGVVVLFVLRPALGSAHFTLPRVQIVVGAVLLGYAAIVAASAMKGRRYDEATGLVQRRLGPHATRVRELLSGPSLWIAAVLGAGMALPSVDYLSVLALIAGSGAAVSAQFCALVLFNLVAFGFVEIPLVCYLVAPDRTLATLTVLRDWLRARRRRDVAALLAVVGCVLIGAGLAGL